MSLSIISSPVKHCRSDATTVALGSHLHQNASPPTTSIAPAPSSIWTDCELPLTPAKPALAPPASWSVGSDELEPVVTPEHLKPGYRNDWILSDMPPSPPNTPPGRKEPKWKEFCITPEHPDFNKDSQAPTVDQDHWMGGGSEAEGSEHEGSDTGALSATQATIHYEAPEPSGVDPVAENRIDEGPAAPAAPSNNLAHEGSDLTTTAGHGNGDTKVEDEEDQEMPKEEMPQEMPREDANTDEPKQLMFHVQDQRALRNKKKQEALAKAAAKAAAKMKASKGSAAPKATAKNKAKAKAQAKANPDIATEASVAEASAAPKKKGWPKGKAKSKPQKSGKEQREGDKDEDKDAQAKAKGNKRKNKGAAEEEEEADPDYEAKLKKQKKSKCLVTDKQKQHLKTLPCMFEQFVVSVLDAGAEWIDCLL